MKVLAAIDLMVDGHDWLIARAGGFAARLGATVDVVFVQPSPATAREADDTLDALRSLLFLVPESQRGEARLEVGDIVEVLVRLSTTYDALVVGPRGPAGIAALLEGPVASRVLRRARCPVLVPRGGSWPDVPLRMLMGVDVQGDIRQTAMVLAGQWAGRLGAKLDGVYATADRAPSGRDAPSRQKALEDWRASREGDVRALNGLLVHVPEAARGAGRVEPGEAEEVLIGLSKQYDLIVVGNRDREGISRYLLGTVATQVVRESSCDVLTLPTASLDG